MVTGVRSYLPASGHAYHPATFQDRGAAVAFTTPMLAGARVRNDGRRGKELVISNPSGGRGVYIMPLAGVREQYRLTVHDVMLLSRINALPLVAPSTVRKAVWSVAGDGFAGPDARDAAQAVTAADRRQALAAEFHLLGALIQQVEPSGGSVPTDIAHLEALQRRGHGVLTRLGRSIGRGGPELGRALVDLAALFAAVGVPQFDTSARIMRLIDRLQRTRNDIAEAFGRIDARATGGGSLARSMIASADIVLPCARAALAAARALTADPLALLARWFSSRPAVIAAAIRTEWFLDGWEQICLLWLASPDAQARLAALFEMAQIIPLLPREAMQWSPAPLPPGALSPTIHVASHNDDWRTGASAMRLIDRNERIRAMSL